MEYNSLSNSTTEKVWEAFNDAFSDYEVPIQMPLENLSVSVNAEERITPFHLVDMTKKDWLVLSQTPVEIGRAKTPYTIVSQVL